MYGAEEKCIPVLVGNPQKDHLKDSKKEENYNKNVYITEYSHVTQLGY
jgi:hypothetical protein